MYIPPAFAEDRLDVLHDFMRQHDFATLITSAEAGPLASHVPMLLIPDKGRFGTLHGHVAIQNPHAQQFADAESVLAIFHGPHGYISPTWYVTPTTVPTWNYIVVHAYGRARTMNDDELREHLHAMTRVYESSWSADRLPADVFDKLRQSIVGFAIEITRIEGKWKLGQNRTLQDRQGAIQGLRDAGANELADLMAQTFNPSAQSRCD
jgi:transcriptional regulator